MTQILPRTSACLIASGAALVGLLVSAAGEVVSQTPAAPAVDTTVTVNAGMALEFEPATIALKQGLRVRLRFINAGSLPHNIVFVRNEDDLDALASAASKAGGNYVPLEMKDRIFGYTLLASPGQTLETTFVVPPPGTYTYVCLMSGHSNVMLGTLRSLK